MRFLMIILKNVVRNPLRAALTTLGTMVLVFVVTLVWSVLAFLDKVTEEKSRDIKAIVTERWRLPSMLPYTYAAQLADGAARHPDDVRPMDWMAWQFYGGTLDPVNRTRDNIIFAVATDPKKVGTMMDELELDQLPPEHALLVQQGIEGLIKNRQGLVIGQERLKAINKRVGERIKVYSLNFKEIDLEFDIIGVFPPGRYDNSAVMNAEYLNASIDAFGSGPGRQPHPMADKCLNLVWLKVPDTPSFVKLAQQVNASPLFSSPRVKCETASSGIAVFLEAFRDLIWGMRWLLCPAALVTLSLVIANAISISVRERRVELAVLKVLGFRPTQVMMLVLGEALLIGTLAGFGSAVLTYLVVNEWMGGIKFPIAMFGSFYIPADALWWGTAMGTLTALAGSFFPAFTARNVKAAEVFAKVA